MIRAFDSLLGRRSFAIPIVGWCATALLLAAAVARAQVPATPATPPAPTTTPAPAAAAVAAAPTAEQIAALEKSLSGSTLVGQFTVNGAGDTRASRERYELTSVKHMQGDTWLVTARIKYGNTDVTVPLPLPIRFAGDTPVITLDNFAIPGMGSYSARVMFYENRYMGYWSGKDHGGYMFGTIERPKAEGDAKPADQGAKAADGAAK